MQTEDRKYKNPPIVEAICEFRLPKELAWDISLPGIIYSELKDEFTDKKSQQIRQIELSPDQTTKIQATERIMLYKPKRQDILIQIDTRLAVINKLKPYEGWESFKKDINFLYDKLCSAITFTNFEKIGLRYINQIKFLPSEDANKFFTIQTQLQSNLPKELFEGVFILAPTEDDKCKVDFRNDLLNKATPNCWFDIDYFSNAKDGIPKEKFLDWLENAHTHIRKIFENNITDAARKKFNEI